MLFSVKYFLLSIACLIAIDEISGTVLKYGRQAPISINEMATPIGSMYLKSMFFQLIFPGTKWCGDGDIAKDYNDLGAFSETDMCCRAHDYCEDILHHGEMKENLINMHTFTRLHCNCDSEFYACLNKATNDKVTSQLIGISYFDVLAPKCYSFMPPATCVKTDRTFFFFKRCVQYTYDCSVKSKWQWFDVPKWSRYLY